MAFSPPETVFSPAEDNIPAFDREQCNGDGFQRAGYQCAVLLRPLSDRLQPASHRHEHAGQSVQQSGEALRRGTGGARAVVEAEGLRDRGRQYGNQRAQSGDDAGQAFKERLQRARLDERVDERLRPSRRVRQRLRDRSDHSRERAGGCGEHCGGFAAIVESAYE